MATAPRRAGFRRSATAVLVVGLAVLGPMAASASPAEDPLAAAIHALQERIAEDGGGEAAQRIRESSAPTLEDASRALDAGRRWLALSRLALVWRNLEAVEYRERLPAELRTQVAGLESEWGRLGPQLTGQGAAARRPDWGDVPAAARAIGEAAWGEVEVYYEASLEYGRNTAPDAGFFYLGAAKAQLALARLTAQLVEPSGSGKALVLRSLAPEIAAVESELLSAYRPPLSIEAHPTFIHVSALLKQASELDDAGLRHGALWKLLDARLELSRLLRPDREVDETEVRRRTQQIARELERTALDSTLAELFLESARFAVADPDPESEGPETAAAILDDVLPLYRAALGPPPPFPPGREPRTSVTLVRWPYT